MIILSIGVLTLIIYSCYHRPQQVLKYLRYTLLEDIGYTLELK
jgi:hypothetical protein